MKIPKPRTMRRRSNAEGTKEHEARIAKHLGGHGLPASGAGAFSKWQRPFAKRGIPLLDDPSKVRRGGEIVTRKGDIATPTLHVEHKRTKKKSISLKREWLEKVSEGAAQEGKEPALVVTFEKTTQFADPRGMRRHQDWAVIPLALLKRFLHEAE